LLLLLRALLLRRLALLLAALFRLPAALLFSLFFIVLRVSRYDQSCKQADDCCTR
jgi:hypothetical protein